MKNLNQGFFRFFYPFACVCVCVCACVRACVRARVCEVCLFMYACAIDLCVSNHALHVFSFFMLLSPLSLWKPYIDSLLLLFHASSLFALCAVILVFPSRPYWAIQRSWFARVNALCNLSRKKSREVAAHFLADF